MPKNLVDEIESEITEYRTQEQELATLQNALSTNPEFTRFLELSSAVNKKMAEVREHIEAVLVPAYEQGKVGKKIEGEWGSVTITESDKFIIDKTELPKKFYRVEVDEAKIRKTYQLEGIAPKGTTHYKKYGIMLRIGKK